MVKYLHERWRRHRHAVENRYAAVEGVLLNPERLRGL